MPTLKAQGGEAAGALGHREEQALLWGRCLTESWEKAPEWARWLRTPEARALWKRHRARLIREWLRTMPRELPAGSLLYDTPQQKRELERMIRKAWDKFERRTNPPKTSRGSEL